MKESMRTSVCAIGSVLLSVCLILTMLISFGPNVTAEDFGDSWVIENDENGGDCYLIGSWLVSTKTCTLTSNVTEAIVIDADGITLDGDGHTVTAGSYPYGVYVPRHSDVTVKEVEVSGFEYGIYLTRGKGNVVSDSKVSDNTDFGIYLSLVYETTLANNLMIDNSIFIDGNQLGHWNTHSIDTTNTVNGSPVYFWKDASGGKIPSGAGQVILANCTGVRVKAQELDDGSAGIVLGFSSGNLIVRNDITYQDWYGIYLYESASNTIKENSLLNNYHGIFLSSSTSNTINENTISNNDRYGISLYYESDSNTVRENIISYNDRAFSIHTSSSNTIAENTISNNVNGITMRRFSYSNTIVENIISNNGRYGIYLNHYCMSNTIFKNYVSENGLYGIALTAYSDSNTIFHNNFVANNNQAYVSKSDSNWENADDEGNYWSDYEGEDTNGDGIGDTNLPHQGVDWYPLMNQA